jgi:hypothetical protein
MARNPIVESPKFGGQLYGFYSRIRKTKEFRAIIWCELVEKPFDKRQLTNNVGS